MKIHFTKKKKKYKKNDLAIYSSLYWRIILGFAFMGILFSFVFGLYLFFKVDKEVLLSSEELGSQTQTIKQERIENVLNYFNELEKKSAEIVNLPSLIIDPSI